MASVSIYDTLSAIGDAGESIQNTPRKKQTTYMDSYTQTVSVGMRSVDKSISFTFSGNYADVKAINDFFERNINDPFWYQYVHQPKKLYELASDDWQFTHVAGLKYSVSATLKETTMLTANAATLDDILPVSDVLEHLINVTLPFALRGV